MILTKIPEECQTAQYVFNILGTTLIIEAICAFTIYKEGLPLLKKTKMSILL